MSGGNFSVKDSGADIHVETSLRQDQIGSDHLGFGKRLKVDSFLISLSRYGSWDIRRSTSRDVNCIWRVLTSSGSKNPFYLSDEVHGFFQFWKVFIKIAQLK